MTADDADREFELVDAHCHLDLFGDEEQAVVERVQKYRVHTIAVTNAPSVFFHTEELSRRCAFIHPAIGLHPELASSHQHEIDHLLDCLRRTRFVGEVGLDYTTRDQSVRRHQRIIFDKILKGCDEEGSKVLTVHSRRAVNDVLAAIGNSFPGLVILHWFSGTESQLERAMAAGCWFSVNPAMLKSKTGKQLISRMPLGRLLSESDGPFVSVDRRKAEPKDCENVADELAAVLGRNRGDVLRQLVTNFHQLTE